MNKIVIADLHLSDEVAIFEKFCQEVAIKYDELYILGDLFDFYLGDDLISSHYQTVVNILKQLSEKTQIFIMVGNRDFLMNQIFAQKSHTTIIKEPYVLDNYILIHGDSLVTDDIKYQNFKNIIQSSVVKFLLNNTPKKLRLKIANKIKQASAKSKQQKTVEIMDVNWETCDKFMQKYINKNLIHGHTHKLATHNHANFQRFVLGDWRQTNGNAIVITDKITRITIAL